MHDPVRRFQFSPISPEREAEIERKHQQAAADKRADAISQTMRDMMDGVGRRYEHTTLESFRTSTDDQRAAVSKVRKYLDHLQHHLLEGDGLLFYGPPGTGKDHLLVAAMRVAIQNEFQVQWVNGLELFGELRDRIDREQSEDEFIRRLSSPTILAISDPIPPWGALTQFQASILFRVVDRRYRDNKPIWTTLNVSGGTEMGERLGEQIRDRLRHRAVCVQCNWSSYRSPDQT